MVRASLLIFASLFAKTSASCSPGNFLDGASCTTCPAARWQELDSYEGTSCPNECGTATVAGKYAAATGQTSEAKACVDTATACGAGRYGAVTGMTSSADACPNECDAGRSAHPMEGAQLHQSQSLNPRVPMSLFCLRGGECVVGWCGDEWVCLEEAEQACCLLRATAHDVLSRSPSKLSVNSRA